MIGPYAAIAAAWLASVFAVGIWAYGAGKDTEVAAHAREVSAAQQAGEAAAQAAAVAISKIEVKNVTITKALEREVLTREVFRDCRSGPDAVRLLNATPGIAPAASAPGDSELPPAGPAR